LHYIAQFLPRYSTDTSTRTQNSLHRPAAKLRSYATRNAKERSQRSEAKLVTRFRIATRNLPPYRLLYLTLPITGLYRSAPNDCTIHFRLHKSTGLEPLRLICVHRKTHIHAPYRATVPVHCTYSHRYIQSLPFIFQHCSRILLTRIVGFC
jgi:hypothetical protein